MGKANVDDKILIENLNKNKDFCQRNFNMNFHLKDGFRVDLHTLLRQADAKRKR